MRRWPVEPSVNSKDINSVTHDVNAYKGNKNFLASKVIDGDGNADDCDNVFTDTHARSSVK